MVRPCRRMVRTVQARSVPGRCSVVSLVQDTSLMSHAVGRGHGGCGHSDLAVGSCDRDAQCCCTFVA